MTRLVDNVRTIKLLKMNSQQKPIYFKKSFCQTSASVPTTTAKHCLRTLVLGVHECHVGPEVLLAPVERQLVKLVRIHAW